MTRQISRGGWGTAALCPGHTTADSGPDGLDRGHSKPYQDCSIFPHPDAFTPSVTSQLARYSIQLILFLLLASRSLAATSPDMTREGLDFFEKQIRPVLVEHCYSCHSSQADEIQAGLRLDTRGGWQRGGDSGPAIVPADPEKSLLLKAIRYDDDGAQMPPEQKLSDEVIAHFQEWIRMGAPDPREDSRPPTAAEEPASDVVDHWAFQPPKVIPPPPDPAGWAQTTLDRYVAEARQADRLSASPRAGRRQLIRRVYFDLIGLPPTYEQTEAFVTDSSPDAYSRQVEALIASPRFGERWARHWLDVARFADTKGYVFQEDRNYPEAYRYRDWVIRSLNQDRPYDEFLLLPVGGRLPVCRPARRSGSDGLSDAGTSLSEQSPRHHR